MAAGNFTKLVLTVIICSMAGAVSLATIIASSGNFSFGVVVIVVVSLLMAIIGLDGIWTEKHKKADTSEKAKRQEGDARLALLLELMDEDERRELKKKLERQVLSSPHLSDDGEIAYSRETLDALLDHEEPEKRLRG